MNMTGICKACGKDLPDHQLVTICECGWTDTSHLRKHEIVQQKRTIWFIIGFSIVFLIGAKHVFNWGGDAVSIVFLKMGKSVGLISASGLEDVIEICERRGKFECANDAHLTLLRRQPNNAQALQRFAHFNYQLKQYPLASLGYETYIKVGGRDYDSLIEYAQISALQGQKDKAKDSYRMAMQSAGAKILPVKATTGLVRLLIDESQFEEAKRILQEFYEGDEHGSQYLTKEFQILQEKLGERAFSKKTLRLASYHKPSAPVAVSAPTTASGPVVAPIAANSRAANAAPKFAAHLPPRRAHRAARASAPAADSGNSNVVEDNTSSGGNSYSDTSSADNVYASDTAATSESDNSQAQDSSSNDEPSRQVAKSTIPDDEEQKIRSEVEDIADAGE